MESIRIIKKKNEEVSFHATIRMKGITLRYTKRNKTLAKEWIQKNRIRNQNFLNMSFKQACDRIGAYPQIPNHKAHFNDHLLMNPLQCGRHKRSVVVQHVNVHDGDQAIVGTVNGGRSTKNEEPHG